MLLQALVACAGVTLGAVATALGVKVRRGTLTAEGDLDFRGTLGVAEDAPVGFKQIRLYISLGTEPSPHLTGVLREIVPDHREIEPVQDARVGLPVEQKAETLLDKALGTRVFAGQTHPVRSPEGHPVDRRRTTGCHRHFERFVVKLANGNHAQMLPVKAL
jgi:hypothetical protein